MRISHTSLIAVMLVVIAIALAGCTGSSPAAPAGGDAPAAGSPASGSPGNQPAAAGGTDLFGNLNYNWVEYKMSMNAGDEDMTVYYKYNRQTKKCSMRFEGPGMEDMPAGMMDNIDCSGTGASGQVSDPNEVRSDAKVDCSLLDESVTVPAGTFSATRCTVTGDGQTSTSWIAKGKFLVKTQMTTDEGPVEMVLNAYG